MAAFEENCLQFSFKKIILHIRYQDIWLSLRSLDKCLFWEVKKKSLCVVATVCGILTGTSAVQLPPCFSSA